MMICLRNLWCDISERRVSRYIIDVCVEWDNIIHSFQDRLLLQRVTTIVDIFNEIPPKFAR